MNLRGRVLSLLWARLHRTMKQQLLSACEELELSEAFAEAQTERYSRYGEVDYDAHHSRLLAWVVARCGYESRTTSVAFEEDLPSTATGPLVAPGWVLGVAPVGSWQRRLPCRFLVPVGPDAVETAYEGLVAHVEHWSSLDESVNLELFHTSMIWRVGAIADGLEDGAESNSESLRARLGVLCWKVKNQPHFSDFDKQTWRAIDHIFADRRNVLSHLADRKDLTFDQCVQHALADRGAELRQSAAAISLAVAHRIFEELINGDASRAAAAAAARAVSYEMQYIDV